MKTITVDMGKWGAHSLLNRDTGKMCCLGFASEQLGVAHARLIGLSFPSHVHFYGYDTKEPEEFTKFKDQLMGEPSESLTDLAFDLLVDLAAETNSRTYSTTRRQLRSYSRMLATINDAYHSAIAALNVREETDPYVKSTARSLTAHTQRVLRLGFEELGDYTLAFTDDAPVQ